MILSTRKYLDLYKGKFFMTSLISSACYLWCVCSQLWLLCWLPMISQLKLPSSRWSITSWSEFINVYGLWCKQRFHDTPLSTGCYAFLRGNYQVRWLIIIKSKFTFFSERCVLHSRRSAFLIKTSKKRLFWLQLRLLHFYYFELLNLVIIVIIFWRIFIHFLVLRRAARHSRGKLEFYTLL